MPDAVLRASVRRMVEFSMRGGDLLPASAAAMQEGSRAHRARQQSAQAIAERTVQWQGACGGIQAEIQGRVDLLWMDRDPILVDELKLISDAGPLPEAAVPAHRMQAVCYGFMLCEELSLTSIAVRVSYVTEAGAVRVFFEETLEKQAAEAQFLDMLRPLAAWHSLQQVHLLRRNNSLEALRFPYPDYRLGQREMAVQVYTAIARKKRLFASLPTGTGKSAAALFPALKALAAGKTKQIFYLTARGTAQLSALDALERMANQDLSLRACVITAREKCCPQSPMRCHPDFCPRARGYYDREQPALNALCAHQRWTAETIQAVCEEYRLCPFEFSLALCEISDVVICDYNYVFDPLVSLKRIIGQGSPVTLLMDEAHNLPGRVREMLSAQLDGRDLAALRRETGKLHGRKSPLYSCMTALLAALRDVRPEDVQALQGPSDALIGVMAASMGEPQAEGSQAMFRILLQLRMALERQQAQPGDYSVLLSAHGKEKALQLLCLNVSDHLAAHTRRMTGSIGFSATLSPLREMKTLLGGDGEDATFALPSPFPPERLLVMTRSVDTRYQQREATAESIARSILTLFQGRSGKYIAYFPSYAYLAMIQEKLEALRPDLPLHVQGRNMGPEERNAFLYHMRHAEGALLSLCVLGGVFSEGIDLPGGQLIGVAVVGVGLPQVNEIQEALRRYYDDTLGDGFAYAYRYPGMQKVLQAVGRVIRSETDAGAALLLDSRYREPSYRHLLPPHYRMRDAANDDEIRRWTQEFWQTYGINKR